MSVEASIAGFTRLSIFDPLRASRFWLYDVAPIDGLDLPVFMPLSGFTSITAPEITVETQTISEGNWAFSKRVVKSAEVGPIVLSRGVTFYNSDFYNWIKAAIAGNTGSGQGFLGVGLGGVTYRRSLLLVHFFRNVPAFIGTDQYGNADTTSTATVASVTALAALGTAAVSIATGLETSTTGGVVSAAQLASLEVWGALQPHSLGIKVPARAFLLKDCIPTRYKSGTDFDANSGDISIQELEVQPEMIEEIALSA